MTITKEYWRYTCIFVVVILLSFYLIGIPAKANEPIYLPVVQTTPPKWEYHVELVSLYYKGDLPNLLAKRGSEGWELCTRTDREQITELIFKRPK